MSTRFDHNRRLKSQVLATASGVALLVSLHGANAQPAGQSVEQVTVTGSRISTPGYEAPTPITQISEKDLQIKAIQQVTDVMNDIPQLTPFTGVSTGSLNAGLSTFNLRGVGTSNTLVMVDGRRVSSTTPLGGVDTGVFPVSLIKNVTVVTGGASAAYGSDAVAGVVNITLDNKFEGFKANIQAGTTAHMDNQELNGGVAFGFGFAGGKGHFTAALDADTNNGFLQGDRKWGSQGYAWISNPACSPNCPTGQYKNVFVKNVSLSKTTNGGVITSGPLAGIQFGPGGTVLPFNKGTFAGSNFMSGGDGTNDNAYASVEPRYHRNAAYGRVSYDILPEVTVWGDALYANDINFYYLIPNYNNAGDLPISRQNAFLPATIASMMDADHITSFNMGRANQELGWNGANATATVQRYALGLDGSFGETWQWHAFGQIAANNYYFTQRNNMKVQNFKNAVDSVVNPAVGGVPGVAAGVPVCRSTLANANNGCVPLNPFGLQGYGSSNQNPIANTTFSPALINYVEGTDFYNETNVENDFALNVSGAPINNWAGPVSVAFGVEHRFEGTAGTSDPLSQQLGWKLVNAIPLNGKYKVTEGYLETEVPLLKNVPYAEDLTISGAGRLTSYSTSGLVETWKLGLNWTPFDDLRLRATRSADIRAPNTSELFTSRAQNSSLITNPATNQTLQATVVNGGNPNLKPEIGNTITAGGVYSPSWLPGFDVSADWYQLHITDAIITTPFQTIVNNCYAGQTIYCPNVITDASGNITSVSATSINAQSIQTDGWDFESSYGFAVDSIVDSWKGDVRIRGLGSYTRSLNYITGNVAQQYAGTNLPHWRWNVSATYSLDPVTFTVEGRWIGNSVENINWQNNIDVPYNGNRLDGRFTVNLSAQYQILDALQVYARINNVFDVDPPISPGTTNVVHAVNSTLYDPIGRDFMAGLRVQM
jgi:iron complex outermembrane receptor protein